MKVLELLCLSDWRTTLSKTLRFHIFSAIGAQTFYILLSFSSANTDNIWHYPRYTTDFDKYWIFATKG